MKCTKERRERINSKKSNLLTIHPSKNRFMFWNILDIILNFFNLFPNKKDDDATEYFKK